MQRKKLVFLDLNYSCFKSIIKCKKRCEQLIVKMNFNKYVTHLKFVFDYQYFGVATAETFPIQIWPRLRARAQNFAVDGKALNEIWMLNPRMWKVECFGERQLAEFQWDFGLNKELRPTRDKISCVPDLILRHVHVLFFWAV